MRAEIAPEPLPGTRSWGPASRAERSGQNQPPYPSRKHLPRKRLGDDHHGPPHRETHRRRVHRFDSYRTPWRIGDAFPRILVSLYLQLPAMWKLLGKQFLVVGRK